MYQELLKCVETGEFTNDTDILPLKFDATYLLVTREVTVKTGKVYGYRARLYATPSYDTDNANAAVAPSAANLAASSNAGVTLGTTVLSGAVFNWDKYSYGITLKATNAYQVSYALYELHNSYGDYMETGGGYPEVDPNPGYH